MLLLLIVLAFLNVLFSLNETRSRTSGLADSARTNLMWIDGIEAVLANIIFIAASSLAVHYLFCAPAPLSGDATMVASALSTIMLISALMQKFGPSDSESSRKDFIVTIGIVFALTTWAALGFSTLLPATIRLTAGKRLAELIVIIALYPATNWLLGVLPISYWSVRWFVHTAHMLGYGKGEAMAVFSEFKGALEVYNASPHFLTYPNREALLRSADFNMEFAEKAIRNYDWNAVLYFSRQGLDHFPSHCRKGTGKNPVSLC